ncbi:hypothetical protein [Lentzea tibetensis]|uniref:hypothetical protein n=1 Tax=Lentzea tibetensis TaxID=2591470 RepID=UPI001645170D|nr:hypothetical protein [Lentzea tibetensis]
MTADHPDHGAPDEVDAREIREAFGVRIARIRAELTSTWNKLRQVEGEHGDEDKSERSA